MYDPSKSTIPITLGKSFAFENSSMTQFNVSSFDHQINLGGIQCKA